MFGIVDTIQYQSFGILIVSFLLNQLHFVKYGSTHRNLSTRSNPSLLWRLQYSPDWREREHSRIIIRKQLNLNTRCTVYNCALTQSQNIDLSVDCFYYRKRESIDLLMKRQNNGEIVNSDTLQMDWRRQGELGKTYYKHQQNILEMPQKFVHLWDRLLDRIHIASNRIHPTPLDVPPIHSELCLVGLKPLGFEKIGTHKKLQRSIINPVQYEKDSSIVFISKQDQSFQLCVSYWKFNLVTFKYVYLFLVCDSAPTYFVIPNYSRRSVQFRVLIDYKWQLQLRKINICPTSRIV